MSRRNRVRSSKIAWGFFWLLLAGLILVNLFGNFMTLGVWSIIVGSIALIILFNCLATLSLASIPIPLAILYYIFQPPVVLPDFVPFELPFIPFWTLVLVTILTTIGLHILLPRRFTKAGFINININENKKGYKKTYTSRGVNVSVGGDEIVVVDVRDKDIKNVEDGENADYVINLDSDGDNSDNDSNSNDNSNDTNNQNNNEKNKKQDEHYDGTKIEEGDDANNPYIHVSFGYASRYLQANNLKTAELTCSFGGMEVYFDNVTLHPDGAEVNITCSFGSIEVYVPSHWRVIDELNSSLANAEISRKLQGNDPSAPTLTVTGNVSLGNCEIKRIKGD